MTLQLPPGASDAVTEDAPSQATTHEILAQIEDALGYRVCTPDGTVLGRLAWLRYGFHDGRIEALMVRPSRWRGLFSVHEQSIPSERIESVVHRVRQVIVNAPPTPAARA